jgi:hypothetical protein
LGLLNNLYQAFAVLGVAKKIPGWEE